MAGVFLSYDRDDTAEARPVAAALEKAGHSVWWDLHVRGGAQFSKVIEEALKAADAVVVLWSKNSIESAWVRDEASAGRDRGILIPVSLDRTDPPMGFRQFQTIDLSGWRRRKSAPGIRELLQAIDATARGIVSSAPPPPHPSLEPQRKLGRVPLLAGIGALLIVAVAVALFLWRPWSSGSAPSVAVSPADASPASADLARHLLTSLGELQAPSAAQVDLVGAERGDRASLGFEVSASNDAQRSRGNLVLLDGKTRSLLWSKAFERPGPPDDLRQQISYAAARVLRCALEAYPHDHLILNGETLRLYLNGCAAFSDEDSADSTDLVPVFRQIVTSAPTFAEGWSKLLMSESQSYVNTGDAGLRTRLTADIRSARAVSPQLAAAYAAEMDMLPEGAWSEKLAIADRGIAANPNDTWLLMLRSEVFGDVGRLRDASDDARSAAHADPLSPQLRGAYADSLAAAGQLDAALSELAAAERLWPDSGSVARNKFQINFDYGDPRYALQVIRSGVLQGGWAHTEPFMEARIDPTPANVARAIENAQASYRRNPALHIWLYVEVLSTFNRYDDALSLLMSTPIDQARSVTGVTFAPWPAKFWHHPQSLAYAQRVGLLRFWRSSGKWPDFCFDPDLPFDCKKEAAKLSA